VCVCVCVCTGSVATPIRRMTGNDGSYAAQCNCPPCVKSNGCGVISSGGGVMSNGFGSMSDCGGVLSKEVTIVTPPYAVTHPGICVDKLLLHCCYTVVTLLLYCCHNAAHYCYTVVTLLSHYRNIDRK
jgi:hypothetical protein